LISDRDLPLLGVLYLAASLRKAKVEVQIADLIGVPEDNWYLPEGDIYGVSLVTPQVPYAKKVIQHLRNRTRRGTTIAVGGPHVSALPQWSLDNLDADFAFVGEADVEFAEFAAGHWPRGTWPSIVHCKPPDVTKLPLPARDLVDIRSFHGGGINKYVKDFHYEGYMNTGRGCPYNCAFCGQRAITKGIVRPNSVANVIREVQTLLREYECDLIYFEDDTFNISDERVLPLCRAFSGLGFSWHCLCRADRVNPTVLRAMHDAGCENITFGFESGSDQMLKAMNKGTTVADNLRAAELVQKAGMTVRGQMIVGFPGETRRTIWETDAFIRAAAVDKWGLHAFVPLPGSDVWNRPGKYGFQIDREGEDFEIGYHTIGKSGEWAKVWGRDTAHWLSRLRSVASERNIDRGT